MMQTLRLTVHGLRTRAVIVPMTRPVETASGMISTAPLVLIDLITDEGVTGSSYVFAYTPLALGPVAKLIANLEVLIAGDTVAPIVQKERLMEHP